MSSRVKDRDGKIKFENYEIAHFRLLTDANYLPYGRSFIEPARKTYKQYVLMKDAMLLHRITRAPEKRVFTVNVGNIPPAEVVQHKHLFPKVSSFLFQLMNIYDIASKKS